MFSESIMNTAKLKAIFEHRVSSMLDDGYFIRVDCVLNDGCRYVVLRHRINGNKVSLRGDFKKDRMTQFSNGTQVYDGKINP